MKVKPQSKQKFTLRQQFQQLIESLRSNTVFENKPHLCLNPSVQPLLQEGPEQGSDVTPITQRQTNPKGQARQGQEKELSKSKGKGGVEYEEMEIKFKESLEVQQEDNDLPINRGKSQLLPDKGMAVPINEGRIGEIKHQNTSVNSSLQKKIAKHAHHSIRYSKLKPEPEHHFPYFPQQVQHQKVSIKLINDVEMIKYWNSASKITQQSTSSQIYRYFSLMMDSLSIDVDAPTIQKYKNCVYFGEQKIRSVYQGLIYYFSEKIYYGQFLGGVKHGHGVEINFRENVKYAGLFNAGSKNGFFFVQKEKQNYEGTLHYGLYHGQGKLVTEEWVYQGSFENGKKQGYGQQFYPKTGLKLQGYFKEGTFQNIHSQGRKKIVSEAQLPNKTSKIVTLQKSGSYDMRVQLASKLLNSERSKNYQPRVSQFNYIGSPLEDDYEVPEVQFQSDSHSLFDLIKNKNKNKKYDFYIDQLSRKLPKINLEGLQRKEKSYFNPEEAMKTPKKHGTSKQVSSGQRQIQGQNGSDLPLFSRRNIVNSPIHKL